MQNIQKGLGSAIKGLSNQNYEKSLTYFRFWFEVGRTHSQIPADLIFDTIHEYRAKADGYTTSIYPKAHLILRFVDDVESDPALAPYCPGLRSRFCAKIVQEFFDSDLGAVHTNPNYGSVPTTHYADVNLIAHCANLGYVDENTIRNHILQSLISHAEVYEHQVAALAILFKLAGATFEAYTDPAVIDRCFEILKTKQYSSWGRGLVRVSEFSL